MGPFENKARATVAGTALALWIESTLLDWVVGWPVAWYLIPLGILVGSNVVSVAGFAWGRKEGLEIAIRDSYTREAAELAERTNRDNLRASLDPAGQNALDLVEDAIERIGDDE